MQRLCRPCATSITKAPCRMHPGRQYFVLGQHMFTRFRSDNTKPRRLFEGYETDLLDAPLHTIVPQTRTSPAPPPPDALPKTEREQILEKARIVFGSRLAGPAERRREIEKASQNVAGILVPPKPEEPDNCCMSGCVNCVWDRFRDELEEWAEQSVKARAKIQEQRLKGGATDAMGNMPSRVASGSMDDDGVGSETNWDFGEEGADLFAGIPVGIREFMKVEKMLKERHGKEKETVANG